LGRTHTHLLHFIFEPGGDSEMQAHASVTTTIIYRTSPTYVFVGNYQSPASQ